VTGRAGLALVAALTVLFHLQLFARPYYNADETIYSAVASRLNAGAVLYAGAVDHKPPAIYLTYAAIFRVFGQNAIHAVHAVCVLWVLATALLVGALARARAGDEAGTMAALLYGTYTSASIPKWFLAANSELFMQLPVVAGLLVATRWGRRPFAGALAGALIGVGALYKLQGVLVALPLAYLVVVEPGAPLRPRAAAVARALPALGAAGLGVLLPFLVVALALRAQGAWDALLFWPLGYASRYAVGLDLGDALGRLAARGSFFCCTLPALPIGAYLGVRALSRTPDRGGVAALIWLGAAFVAVSIGGRFFAHYFIQLLPPLAILAAAPLWGRLRGAPTRDFDHFRALGRAALWVLVAAPPVAFFAYAPWSDDYLSIDPREPRAVRAVGEYVKAHTPPEARVLVWGNSPEIYLHADRVPATRFVFTNYQTGKMWGTPANEDGAPFAVRSPFVVPESWDMLLQDLARTPPQAIVDAAAGGLNRFRGLGMTEYPPLRAVLEGYRLADRIEGVPVYVRR
jgi:4-amino-4-deoxy-L-arabinose transferase-like glycosyltransferase